MKYVVGSSFGKDSTATLLTALEKGIQIDEILSGSKTRSIPFLVDETCSRSTKAEYLILGGSENDKRKERQARLP